MAGFSRLVEAYRRTAKPRDIFWNKYVARPLATPLVVMLAPGSVTPNQLTLASLFVFVGGVATLLAFPGHLGLILAVAIIEASYVLDCADGQLARLRGTSSPVGAHLDFLMDELKAFLLVAGTGARLWHERGDERWLLEGLAGLVGVAAAISLTTFVRRPEYVAATGAAPPPSAGDYGQGFAGQGASGQGASGQGASGQGTSGQGASGPGSAGRAADAATSGSSLSQSPSLSLPRRIARLVEGVGRFVVHYPSYLVVVAAADRLDWFLHVYAAVNLAYGARTLLGVARKLGRFA